MARGGLTDVGVRNLRPKALRYEMPDAGARGLYVVVQPSGRKSFAVRYRYGGRPRKLTLKVGIMLAAARKEAAAAMYDVEQGRDPIESKKNTRAKAKEKAEAEASTLQTVCEGYLNRGGKELRSIGQRRRVLERLVYEELGVRQINAIKRSEIVRLLDKIEDQRGPAMADMTLAILRRIMSWHSIRDDDFRSPIVRGMARTKPKERARTRTLTDDELRRVWATANTGEGPFPALVKLLLLTATRRNEAARMIRSEMEPRCILEGGAVWDQRKDIDWIIPGKRYKSKRDTVVPLSAAARSVLDSLPRIENCPYVFTTDGMHPIASFSKFKRRFDQACGVTGWTLHDLRRTARTLMSRASVDPNHAERCLGHVIGGVRETYDQYQYRDEKACAFEVLAAQIQRIVET